MQRTVKLWISTPIAALAALSIAVSAPGAPQRQAVISVAASDVGLSVAGRHFLPRERVVLRASFSGKSLARTVRASATGRFAVELSDADTSCGQLVVTASGSRGSTAQFRRSRIAAPCGIVIQP